MPGATPKYALPYPVGTDPVANGDDTMKALAEATEAALEGNLGAQRMVLAAEAMGVLSGIANLTATFRNRVRVWQYADAATSILGGTLLIPSTWHTMHVDLWWTNASAAVGNVAWRLDVGPLVEGVAIPDPPTGSGGPTVEVVAPGDGVVKKTRMTTGLAVATGPHVVEIMRHGALAGDTLAGVVGFIALEFTRAS